MPCLGLAGKFYVVDEIPVFDLLAYLEPCFGQPGNKRCSRSSVKIEDYIELFLSDLADEFEKRFSALVFFYDHDIVQVWIAFEQLPVRLFHEVGDKSIGKTLPQRGYSRGGHDDVADTSEPDDENFIYLGRVNLLSACLGQ